MGIKIKGGEKFKSLIQELAEKRPDVMDAALDDTADAMSLEAQRIVPVDTGRLRGSINVKREFLVKVIGTNVEYATDVEFGSGPHEIVAKNKKKGIIFGRKVKHPGSQPRPYMRPAFENNRRRVAEFFIKNLS
jgi:phage gpG-like protein